MNKKLLLTCLLSFVTIVCFAQSDKKLSSLISSGNKVFIEINDINKNTDGAYDSFKRHLESDEWSRWDLVQSAEEANFVCRLNIEKKGFNIMSATSSGARVRVVTEILTPLGDSIWKSKRQQGNVSIYTGGDALSDAMRKVIRRSLTVELYGEKK
ncbi:MAG: hypothetical protein SNH27_06145 [Rikenellaceae bacterium]